MTDPSRYPSKVFWSDEDGGFIAEATDLPGCSAFGETQADAIAELQDAIRAWIEAAQKAGNTIPRATQSSSSHSGKLLVRMPKTLHAKLARQAEREGVSLNQFAVFLLSTGAADPRPASVVSRTSFLGHIVTPTRESQWSFGGGTVHVDLKRATQAMFEASTVETTSNRSNLGHPILIRAEAENG